MRLSSEYRRLRRFLRVRSAMIARIDQLDDRLIRLLERRELHAQSLKGLYRRKWPQPEEIQPKGEQLEEIELLITFNDVSMKKLDSMVDGTFKELSDIESSIQRRWARYTIWVSILALGLSIFATFFK